MVQRRVRVGKRSNKPIEQNDEWLVGRRYLSEESMQAALAWPVDTESIVEASALPAA